MRSCGLLLLSILITSWVLLVPWLDFRGTSFGLTVAFLWPLWLCIVCIAFRLQFAVLGNGLMETLEENE